MDELYFDVWVRIHPVNVPQLINTAYSCDVRGQPQGFDYSIHLKLLESQVIFFELQHAAMFWLNKGIENVLRKSSIS